MRIVEAENIGTGEIVRYIVPSRSEAITHSNSTWGTQYDRVERREVTGGEAMLWPKLSAED